MMVMMMARTPSLKASSRDFPMRGRYNVSVKSTASGELEDGSRALATHHSMQSGRGCSRQSFGIPTGSQRTSVWTELAR